MKITNAWIDDPTTRGELLEPQLCVEVTEMPDVTISPESFSGDWTVGKYGPFVKYHCGGGMVSAGDFNVRFRGRFPVVVDITLFLSGHPDAETGVSGFSLPLTRARQLTRKYDPDWRLLVNDRAAESGSLIWLPVQSSPTCRVWYSGAACGRAPAHKVSISNIDFPMCAGHLRAHNENQATRRASKAS